MEVLFDHINGLAACRPRSLCPLHFFIQLTAVAHRRSRPHNIISHIISDQIKDNTLKIID